MGMNWDGTSDLPFPHADLAVMRAVCLTLRKQRNSGVPNRGVGVLGLGGTVAGRGRICSGIRQWCVTHAPAQPPKLD